MDRQIPRGLDSKIIHVDSAFRRADESVNNYKIFFDSYDQKRARIVKDVVGLRINKATIPKVHNNIIPGMNIVNLHITPTPIVTRILQSESDLVQFVKDLSSDLMLATENTKYKISSKNGNQLLISSSSFPGSTSFETDHALLITSEKTSWNISFPITLSISVAESHRILLKPGYYPTSSMIIGELFEAFATLTSSVNANLQYYYDWNDASAETNGWSVYKEARGMWTLYFRTLNDNDNMNIYFSREPGNFFDVLYQLGLRSAQSNNWAIPTSSHNQDTRLYKMSRHTINPTPSTNAANTIIGRSTLNFSSVFELQFQQINLSPQRYVDILIHNIPNYSYLITNSTHHHNDVFARIDLSKHHLSFSSSMNTTSQSNMQDEFDESSSSDTFAIFENNTANKMPLFDPISIDHLEIELVDNMGRAYYGERDHTIEIELTVLGDATAPFEFPTKNIGSVSPPRRQLTELPEFPEHKPRRRHKKKKIKIPEPEGVSPISDWMYDNRLEFGAGTLTFVTVLYLANKIGALFPSSPPHTIVPPSQGQTS
tara:strand:- start:22 stop:1650 length:1629 start_codon:yes stop_codon:yes gene_type:complete